VPDSGLPDERIVREKVRKKPEREALRLGTKQKLG
jgi:hypothetical protein